MDYQTIVRIEDEYHPDANGIQTETFTPSRAAVGGHPLHPLMVTFPVAFLTATLISDVMYARSRDSFWSRASKTLLKGAFVTGIASAATGSIDFWSSRRVRSIPIAWMHALGNNLLLMLVYANLRQRSQNESKGILPNGLALSAVTAVLLGVTGFFGGELISRHRVSVHPSSES